MVVLLLATVSLETAPPHEVLRNRRCATGPSHGHGHKGIQSWKWVRVHAHKIAQTQRLAATVRDKTLGEPKTSCRLSWHFVLGDLLTLHGAA